MVMHDMVLRDTRERRKGVADGKANVVCHIISCNNQHQPAAGSPLEGIENTARPLAAAALPGPA